jgi:hypothetical protein
MLFLKSGMLLTGFASGVVLLKLFECPRGKACSTRTPFSAVRANGWICLSRSRSFLMSENAARFTFSQEGYLPGLLRLEWIDATPGWVHGRFDVRQHHLAPNSYPHAATVVALAEQRVAARREHATPTLDELKS